MRSNWVSVLTVSCLFLLTPSTFAQLEIPLTGKYDETILTLGTLSDVELSPDGKTAVTAGPLGAFLWNVETGKSIRRLYKEGFDIRKTAFTPDSKKLLIMGVQRSIFWNIETGEEILSFDGGLHFSTALTISPDGMFALIGGTFNNYPVEVWDLKTAQLVKLIGEHKGPIFSIIYSPEENTILTGSDDGNARLWDLATGDLLVTYWQAVPAESVMFAPGGNTIITRAVNSLYTWERNTGAFLSEFGDENLALNTCFLSSDGSQIVTVGYTNRTSIRNEQSLITSAQIILIDPKTGAIIQSWDGPYSHTYTTTLSSDGQFLLTGTTQGKAQLWDLASKKVVRAFGNHSGQIQTAFFSPDGSNIFLGIGGGDSIILDTETGQIVQTLENDYKIGSAAYSQDGHRLVTVPHNFSNPVTLWDLNTGDSIRAFGLSASEESRVSISPDGTKVAIGGPGHTEPLGTIWDTETGELSLTLKSDDNEASDEKPGRSAYDRIDFILFSPDGSSVLTGNGGLKSDSDAILWNAKSGEIIHRLSGHTVKIISAAFSGDGKTILTGSQDGSIRRWDTETGEEQTILPSKNHYVISLDLSPDGRYILSSYIDGSTTGESVILWETQTGSQLAVINAHTDDVLSVDFAPDGQTFLTAGEDGTVRVWNLHDVLNLLDVDSFELY